MNRRSFLTIGVVNIFVISGCMDSDPQPLTDITAIDSYPYMVNDVVLIQSDSYGGWKFKGAFARTVQYRIRTRSTAGIDILAFSADEFPAFEAGETVDLLDGSTMDATAASGTVESPSSRATFYLVVDNTGRGADAVGSDVEVEVSLEAETI